MMQNLGFKITLWTKIEPAFVKKYAILEGEIFR